MTQQLLLGLIIILDVVGLAALLYVLPVGNRKDLFFAVTVEPEFTKSAIAQDLIRGYQRSIMLQSVSWIIMSLLVIGYATTLPASPGTVLLIWLLPITLIGQLTGGMKAYLNRRQKVLPQSVHPSSKRSAIISPSDNSESSGVGLLILMGPVVFIILSALVLWGLWDVIPERYPSHWGLDGTANAWTKRSLLGVGAPLLLALPITIVLQVIAVTVPFRSRRLFATGEAAAHELRARQITSKVLILICYLVTIPLCLPAVMVPLTIHFRNLPELLIAGTIILEIVMLTFVIVGFTRSAAQMEKARAAAVAAGETIIGDLTNDRFWKWGIIYYNPDDAAVWVDKRIGYGWTVNMARWQAYAWIIGLIGLPLVLTLCLIIAL